MIARRTFMKRASMVAIAATASSIGGQSRGQQVSNSGGTEPPKLKAPEGACDCHMHIYDPARFAMPPSPRVAPSNATVSHYRLLQKRIGMTRVVVVQPRNYAIDNRVTVDAIAQLGPNARGVAVLHPTVTDAELKALHAAGVRGIRFTLGDPATAVVKVDMIEPLAKRVADLGWHVQFNVEGAQIVELADLLRRLPTQLVFDHLGNPPLPAGIEHPSHAIVRGLVDRGRAWVKLSGAYSNSKIGPPSYPEATRTAQAFVKAAPERLVWGSDWPHPTMPNDNKPNDALLFDLLAEWAPDEATRNRILVRNPEALYGFTPSARTPA
ncbi:MAG: 2-pyrone-4,6-dicarboxylate hydrolase [Betaproteobacteria bacterium]|nr:MAG: 2-pyrone-4,6-dicarboxylate hydrolase [Betaproteobacteria bacterium]